jgi:hypothetical protein
VKTLLWNLGLLTFVALMVYLTTSPLWAWALLLLYIWGWGDE